MALVGTLLWVTLSLFGDELLAAGLGCAVGVKVVVGVAMHLVIYYHPESNEHTMY